jgi:hypothetical protein
VLLLLLVAAGTASPASAGDELEALVPAVSRRPFAIDPGVMPFEHRIAFSPAFGYLGSERMFIARLAYNPAPWLGWEWSLGHNPGESVHAALHSLSAILRVPIPGRFQPYAALGYGMLLVFPGQSINADPITRNAVMAGGGLEIYLRNDLALRADLRQSLVIGSDPVQGGLVAYDYFQPTIGLAFSRAIRP